MRNPEIKKEKFFIICLFILISLPFVNSISIISLNNETVLNTTISNSSMTFSVPVNISSFLIKPYNITLNNVICSTGQEIIIVFWNETNSNKDSSQYCINSNPAVKDSSNSYGGGSRINGNLIVNNTAHKNIDHTGYNNSFNNSMNPDGSNKKDNSYFRIFNLKLISILVIWISIVVILIVSTLLIASIIKAKKLKQNNKENNPKITHTNPPSKPL